MGEVGEIFSSIIKRIRKPEGSQGFTTEHALEAFRRVAASDQIPGPCYGKGSSIILNQIAPGTILREEYFDSEHNRTQYVWWCVGSFDREKGELMLFDARAKKMNDKSPVLHQYPDLSAIQRELKPTRRNGNIEYAVDLSGGTIVDLFLSQRSSYPKNKFWQSLSQKRRTTKIEVMQYGHTVKQKEKEKTKKPLRKLVPDSGRISI